MDLIDLNNAQVAAIKQALLQWAGRAKAKERLTREIQKAAELHRVNLTPSQAADVQYIENMLPQRMQATEEVLAMITEACRVSG